MMPSGAGKRLPGYPREFTERQAPIMRPPRMKLLPIENNAAMGTTMPLGPGA